MLDQLNTAQFTRLLQGCPVGIAIVDSQHTITWMNPALQNLLGSTAEQMLNQSLDTLTPTLQEMFSADSTIHIAADEHHDDLWLICSQHTINDSGITAHYMIDIGPLYLLMQERDQLRDELQDALAIDPITGMPNKKALFQSLEPQVSRSRRYNNLLSVVIMQLSNLDDVTEQQANLAVIAVSQMLNDQVRWADIVGRLNTTEFLLVLPETSAEACAQLCDKLGQRVQEISLPEAMMSPGFKLTARFGYAQWQKGDDVGLLMMRARDMLQ